MIDLKNIRPCPNAYVDGVLEDGRLVEFKASIPRNLDNLARQVVAIANTAGGYIIFGIDDTQSIVGIGGDYNRHISNLELSFKRLLPGTHPRITHEVVNKRDIIIIEIEKASSTAYFSRVETTPARQIAYRYTQITQDEISITKSEMRYTKVFKYMTLEAFLTSLYCKTWRFFEPSKWNDKFEQRFYCADYVFAAAKGNTPQLFATCVTKTKNSAAAWKMYSNGQGLGNHCLQLELDVVELRKQLNASGFHFEEKLIDYKPENVILDLHKKEGKYYKEYFSSFTLDSFLNLLSLKRDAYSYEQEIRLFVIPSNGGKRNTSKHAQHQDLTIEWCNVISKVRIDKRCSDAELATIQRACFSVGINPIIKNYSFIGNNMPQIGLKDVEFERFDIDDMPGGSTLNIT